MGHTETPKFELQIEKNNGSKLIMGVNTVKEAKKEIMEYLSSENFKNRITGKFYLWGNSRSGQSYLRKQRCNYLVFFCKNDGSLQKEKCVV